jgi:hypothetical protein
MKLISMTDFVLEQNNFKVFRNQQILNYANFLKQPLELWMFVPCLLTGGKNVVLEEPTRYSNDEYDTIELQLYNEAKERCLFEGFELNSGIIIMPNKQYLDKSRLKNKAIEDIINQNFILTQTAIKQLGL